MNINQGIHTSEIWIAATRPSNLIPPQYPDLRFSCMECGSLDVFITKGSEKSSLKCLDCSKMEEIA